MSSVAIGFAFRDILQNFLAGILLLLSEPFRIGDQIVINNFEGTVENIQTRATFIKTYDGRRVVIPNSNLFTDSVTVNTAYEKRRLQYDIGIGYGDDIAHARHILLDTVGTISEVLNDLAPDDLVVQRADSSINIRLRALTYPFRLSRFCFMTRPKNPMATARASARLTRGKAEVPRPARIVDALHELKNSGTKSTAPENAQHSSEA